MRKVLVTGGTGYIGSHTAIDLIENGTRVIIVDNLMNSDKDVLERIKEITGVRPEFYQLDLSDTDSVGKFTREIDELDGIIHFAALKSVEESVHQPLKYFDNNLNSTINTLRIAEELDVENFIFSSSCTVYGNATQLPVDENTELVETESPYGSTKLLGEKIIRDYINHKQNMKAILLRYFNPAGAHESAKIGESPKTKATNLVPIITETAIGKRKSMTVFGTDYDTRDGSCIRDYIHVMDLARAHTLSLNYCNSSVETGQNEIFNLGIGEGVSVIEAIQAFEKVTEISLNYTMGDRRPGDVPAIYADYSKAKQLLGWNPSRNIDDIMQTAWNWERERSK